MSIKFILPKLSRGARLGLRSYTIVDADKELYEYPKNYVLPSPNLINIIKSLSLSNDFIRFVEEYRAKYSIPANGFTAKKYMELMKSKKKSNFKRILHQLSWDIGNKEIKGEIKANPQIKFHLADLVFANVIRLQAQPIWIEYPVDGYEEFDSITINVKYQITFAQLIEYMESNSKEIRKYLLKLPKAKVNLSEDKLNNLRLKLGKTSINNIIELEIKKFGRSPNDEKEGAYDAMRQKLSRTSKEIKNLFIYKPR